MAVVAVRVDLERSPGGNVRGREYPGQVRGYGALLTEGDGPPLLALRKSAVVSPEHLHFQRLVTTDSPGVVGAAGRLGGKARRLSVTRHCTGGGAPPGRRA